MQIYNALINSILSVGIDFWLTFCVLVQCHLDWRVRPNILYVIAEWEFAMVKITPNYKHQFYSSSSLMLFISLLPSVIMERIIECQETHFLRLTVKRFRHSTDVKCELFNGVEELQYLCWSIPHVHHEQMYSLRHIFTRKGRSHFTLNIT